MTRITKAMTRQYVLDLMKRYQLNASKALGQRFLINDAYLDLAIEACELDKQTLAIEVGAGIGNLTSRLAEKAGHVLSIEVDESFRKLHEKIADGWGNIQFHYGDALHVDWEGSDAASILAQARRQALAQAQARARARGEDDVAGDGDGNGEGDGNAAAPEGEWERIVVAGNIPYQISGPLLNSLVRSLLPWRRVVLMTQLEVAQRVCAGPGGKTYGALSLKRSLVADARILAEVGPENFLPSPRVRSAVVVLERKTSCPLTDRQDVLQFFRVCDGLFAYRRKQAPNSLVRAGALGMTREQWLAVFEQADFDPNRRGETFDLDEALRLYHAALAYRAGQ